MVRLCIHCQVIQPRILAPAGGQSSGYPHGVYKAVGRLLIASIEPAFYVYSYCLLGTCSVTVLEAHHYAAALVGPGSVFGSGSGSKVLPSESASPFLVERLAERYAPCYGSSKHLNGPIRPALQLYFPTCPQFFPDYVGYLKQLAT